MMTAGSHKGPFPVCYGQDFNAAGECVSVLINCFLLTVFTQYLSTISLTVLNLTSAHTLLVWQTGPVTLTRRAKLLVTSQARCWPYFTLLISMSTALTGRPNHTSHQLIPSTSIVLLIWLHVVLFSN